MSLRSFLAGISARCRSWFRAVVHRPALESEMEAELACHLESLTADLIRKGHTPAAAAREARLALGPVLVHKESMRSSLGLRWWDEFWIDLRYGIRILRKSPGFTAIAATSLALAIGANTTIFSIAKQLLYDRLPVPQPEQLRLLNWAGDKRVAITNLWGNWKMDSGGITSNVFSYPAYEQLKRDNHVLQDLFAFKDVGRLNSTINGNAQVLQGEMVSGNYFAQLGVQPILGRAIQPSDDQAGAAPVGLISAGLWQRAFSNSPDVLGRVIKVNLAPVTVIGVTPRGFTGAQSLQFLPDVFLPLSLQPVVVPKGESGSLLYNSDPEQWWLNLMARTKPGVSNAEAEAALGVSLTSVARATLHPEANQTIPRLYLGDGSRGFFDSKEKFGKPVDLLLSVVGLVLLLACANIASLLLARASARQREISVRLALGARRSRILRQVLTESLLLSCIGGSAGFVLAFAGRQVLPRLMSNPWDASHMTLHFDWQIFFFTAAVTLVAGLLFGIAPSWQATRTEVSSGLKETAQTTTRRRKGLGGKAIVAFQLMISTILVTGAFLFVRTLYNVAHIDPGFRSDHLLLFAIQQPESRYPPPSDLALHQRLEERLRNVPGVEAVTLSEVAFISDSMENTSFLPEGEKLDPNKEQSAMNNAVGATFFETMGIPIIAGRDLDARDTATSPKVAVISQALARTAFPGINPVGRHFRAHFHPREGKPGYWIEVVGVCADTRYWSLKQDPVPMFFEPYLQTPNLDFGVTYEIRTRLKTEAIAPDIRRVVQSIDPDLPLVDLRTQREQIDSTMQQERIFASLTAGFGVLALALGCVGVYGVMSYSVARRTSEIGIRLALGAQPWQMHRMILRESSGLAVAGIIAGTGTALLLTQLVKSMLYGIQPHDPTTVLAGIFLLLIVALAASWIPARRAASVQPMKALRHE
jgi:predicted permease